jgi:hypothetical protein
MKKKKKSVTPCHHANGFVRLTSHGTVTIHASILLRQQWISRYSDWATGWMIGVLGFDFLRRLGIFLFTTASSCDVWV